MRSTPARRSGHPGRPGLTGLAGLVSAGLALAVTEIVAAFGGAGAPSVVSAVGNRMVDALAASLKDLAVALFGTGDKVALLVGIVVVALGFGALAGWVEHRRRWTGAAVIAAFAVVGLWAVSTDAQAAALPVAACLIGAAAGIATLRMLVGGFLAPGAAERRPGAGADAAAPAADPRVRTPSRRAFLTAAGSVGAGAAVLAVGSRRLRALGSAGGTESATQALPAPARTVPVPPAEPTPAGLSPYLTPTADFYRIDTALLVPRVDARTWSLSITGLVDRPLRLTYDDLLAAELVEVPVTISCVSNEIGGDLVGTAQWRGIPLGSLLERAGVRPEAEQVFARSVDGFTAGFPVGAVRDGRTALLAVGMNGEPLPTRHGFPARLVVAGLYGYVSAVKWLAEIRLTPWDGVDGYWMPRGWSKEGPVKTQSRIDVPRAGSVVAPGPAAIAGVAWAPTRGIRAVEVSIDGGAWQAARVLPVASDETWAQWVFDGWTADPGRHRITVRATDGTGIVQDATIRRPDPDGATGHHTVSVTVR
ncbi:MAG: molybdopterin-dependent oxidoreductase [Acidimicrobiales bacterium]